MTKVINKKNYKKGEAVMIGGEEESLGQYIENENDFIVSTKEYYIKTLLELGFHSKATSETEVFNIYAKRTVYNEEIGSVVQYLVSVEDTLKWKRIDQDVFKITDSYN